MESQKRPKNDIENTIEQDVKMLCDRVHVVDKSIEKLIETTIEAHNKLIKFIGLLFIIVTLFLLDIL